jgi:hypothetical protein
MISGAEVANALTGAWRLANRDRGGMRYFDASLGGFWRSFYAAALCAPGYALIVWERLADRLAPDGALHAVLVEGIVYVIGWVAFPLAAYYLVEALDRGRQYLGYIVAYNWANVLQVALYVVAVLVISTGLTPQPLEGALALGITLAVLLYQFYIARIALDLPALPASAMVALDFVLSLLLYALVEMLVAADLAA